MIKVSTQAAFRICSKHAFQICNGNILGMFYPQSWSSRLFLPTTSLLELKILTISNLSCASLWKCFHNTERFLKVFFYKVKDYLNCSLFTVYPFIIFTILQCTYIPANFSSALGIESFSMVSINHGGKWFPKVYAEWSLATDIKWSQALQLIPKRSG